MKAERGQRVRLIWAGDQVSSEVEAYLPAMDIYESGDSLVIEVELPGVKKEGIEVAVENNLVTVEGVKADYSLEAATSSGPVSYLQVERKFGRFRREIELPVACNTREARARFENGILRIEFKRIQEQRGRKRWIPVE